MYQAVLDIYLQKNNDESTNWLMVTIPMDDLNEIEKQVKSVINNCKRSYKNLPICEITIVIFDITNKVISHYKDINLKKYSYNELVMTTTQLANSTSTKKDYSDLFANYEYALREMQKNNER